MSPRTLGLLFAIATAIFWGLYGPALQESRMKGETPFKPFIFIGIAYLVWGCLGGALAIPMMGDQFVFSDKTKLWGFIAGSLGAFGALTLTYAMFKARDASLVMPVVFGGATTVAVITSLILQARQGSVHVDPRQIIGFAMVVIGVVLIQKHAAHGPAPTPPTAASPIAESPANAEPSLPDAGH